MTPQEAALADAKLEELRVLQKQIDARIKQLEEAKAVPAQLKEEPKPQGGDLEAKLLKLPWKTAKSGSCDYVRGEDLPAELLSAGAPWAVKDEVKGEKFHYVIKADGAILRFKRKS